MLVVTLIFRESQYGVSACMEVVGRINPFILLLASRVSVSWYGLFPRPSRLIWLLSVFPGSLLQFDKDL